MKTVLFLIYNENTIGLYDKFIEELDNNSYSCLVLDLVGHKLETNTIKSFEIKEPTESIEPN